MMRSKISNFGLKSNKLVCFPRGKTIILIPKMVEAFWLGQVFLLAKSLSNGRMVKQNGAKPFYCHNTLPATAY